jgi:hypothetical protein
MKLSPTKPLVFAKRGYPLTITDFTLAFISIPSL